MSSGVITMSKRAPIAEIINGRQAELLELMREALGPLTLRDLQTAMDLGRTFVMRHLADLRERGLVDAMQSTEPVSVPRAGQGRTALLYTISRSGSRALARYKRRLDDADKEVVPPARVNMFEQPDYVPHRGAFYRNEGNKHILSRGFSC